MTTMTTTMGLVIGEDNVDRGTAQYRELMDTYDLSIKALHENLKFSEVKASATLLLGSLGLDLDDSNLSDTPRRIAQVLLHFTQAVGRESQVVAMLKQRVFPSEYDQIIVQPDILAHGMCPHHLVPVRYEVSVGYMPNADGYVLGLDKIPRAVKFLALQMSLQESYSEIIANVIDEAISPVGMGVIVVGYHGCITSRGVEQNIPTVSSVMRGNFREEPSVKAEFMYLLDTARKSNGCS
jgi:GTP cyclohydrolase I